MFVFLFLALAGLRLYKDYKRDPGEHRSAKWTQAIVVLTALVFYSSHLSMLNRVLFHFDDFRARFQVPLSALPASVHFGGILVSTVLGSVLLFTVLPLASRSQRALRIFRPLLLVLVPVEAFGFYRGFEMQASGFPPALVFGLPLVAFGVLHSFLFVLYDRPYMRNYFRGPVPIDLSTLSSPNERTEVSS